MADYRHPGTRNGAGRDRPASGGNCSSRCHTRCVAQPPKRGAVYKPEMVEKALAGFFKGSNLGALRELTLRQAAHEVDLRQSAYDETRGFQVPRISEARPSGSSDDQTKERILIHITADPSTAMLIRRGRRVADYLHADCIALFVHRTARLNELPA